MKHYLVTKNIENIGKDAYKLSEEFKANHKEILWKKIILLRENTNITPKRLYRIATEDIEPLKLQVENLLNDVF